MKKVILLILLLITMIGCLKKDVPKVEDVRVPIEKPANPQTYIKGSPVIAYSDIESGPNKGWSKAEPNKGVAVTIWGRNLGQNRGNNYVSVGGVKLTNDSDYANWGEFFPTPFWQRITFWLNNKMTNGNTTITVTINGLESNPLPFTIRDGNIYFVDQNITMGDGDHDTPFNYERSLQFEKFQTLNEGDTVYYRGGTYERMPIFSNGDKAGSLLWFGGSDSFKHKDGTKEKPIAFLAYPGEKPLFSIPAMNGYGLNGVGLANDYLVLSGFSIDVPYNAVGIGGNYIRVIGNDLIGMKGAYGNGSAQVVTGGSGAKILGNGIHGGRSKSRFDHAVYFSGAPIEEGSHLGWNYIYDNDFGRGPEIAVNHQGDRVPEKMNVKSHFVFSNIVDANPQRATFINIFDLSYDEGDPVDPEPIFVYNNIFINGGTLDTVNSYDIGWATAISITRDHSRFYNNTIYNTAYQGIGVGRGVEGHFSTNIQNNALIMNSNVKVDRDEHFYLTDTSYPNTAKITNNLFYDTGHGNIRDYIPWAKNNPRGFDKELNISNENPLFKNEVSDKVELLDFSPIKNSPLIDSGINKLDNIDMLPDYAPITRDIFFRDRKGNFDIGAVEYYE